MYITQCTNKPSLKEKVNSIIVPYAKMERPKDKFCMGHVPVVEILTSGDQEARLPQSAALREELFSLHRDVGFISSSGHNTEQSLADEWPSSPNTALPNGAGRWPNCPPETSCSAGKSSFSNIWFIQLAPYPGSYRIW